MKKKITYLILTLAVVFGFANNANATCISMANGEEYEATNCATGDILLVGEDYLDDDGTCKWGGYSGMRQNGSINAVRLTVVDLTDGHRVSGSADFTNRDAAPSNDLTTVNLPFADARYQSTEKKTRNEILSSGTGYTYTSTKPTIYYWANLPDFGSGGGDTLKNYFLVKFATIDTADMIRIFNILGYDGYKNGLVYEKHALLVEPLYNFFVSSPYNVKEVSGESKNPELTKKQVRLITNTLIPKHNWWVRLDNPTTSDARDLDKWFDDNKIKSTEARAMFKENVNWEFPDGYYFYVEYLKPHGKRNGDEKITTCDIKRSYYYGTASEIWYMMKNTNDPLYTYKAGQGGSIETISLNIGGHVHDDDTVAGLMNASPILGESNRYTIMNHVEENYGLGTMHVWMKYIMEGCPDGECDISGTCPDGSPIPEDGVCPEATPSTCQYPVTVTVSNDCTEGQGGTIEDGASWECVFEAIDAPKNSYQGEFYYPSNNTEFAGNPYCNVACKESIRYTLPATFEEVAGRRFSIGISNEYGSTSTLTPNTIIGQTTCSTAYLGSAENLRVALINYPQFAIDYKNANDKVAEAWDNYQIALTKEKSASNPSQKIEGQYGGDHECADFEDNWVVTNQAAVDACHALYSLLGIADASPCDANATVENRPTRVPRDRCPAGHFEHDGNPSWTYTTVIGSQYTYIDRNGTRHDIKETYETSSCGHHKAGKPDYGVGALRQAYQAAVNYRDNLLKMLNMCNNYQRTYSEFQPKLSFAYSETKYKGSYELAATVQTTSVTNYLVNNQIVDSQNWDTVGYDSSSSVYKYDLNLVKGSKGYIDRYDCNTDGARCTLVPGGTVYPTNVSAINITTKTYNYELPDNANRYIAKNGKSYNTANEAELSDYPYLDSGHSSMPVNYETPGGWYHYYYEFYYANGTANLFGANQKFLKYDLVQPGGQSSYNGLTMADNLLYHCIYKVNCGIIPCDDSDTCPDGSEMPANGKCPDYTIEHKICPSGVPMPISGKCPDNKGLNIIYRTISLNDPFPGEHGDGRDAGANWNGEATVLGTKMSFIEAYIENNRGVETEKVYQQTPMYQFTLTPANIRSIRRYNRAQNADYNDFNLECTNGKYCKSEFLDNGLTEGYFGFTSKNPTGGACFNAYSTDWESCRYTNIGG